MFHVLKNTIHYFLWRKQCHSNKFPFLVKSDCLFHKMSTSDFLRFVFHRYLNSGCRKCLIFFSKTPVILPVSPEVSGCGGSHEPFFLGATWPNIFATCLSKKRNEPVADPQLNIFFNWVSKDPSPDPEDLDLFFQWSTPSADMLRPEVSYLISLNRFMQIL